MRLPCHQRQRSEVACRVRKAWGRNARGSCHIFASRIEVRAYVDPTDAETFFEKIGRGHVAATSCLSFYEAEEAMYRLLGLSACHVGASALLTRDPESWPDASSDANSSARLLSSCD